MNTSSLIWLGTFFGLVFGGLAVWCVMCIKKAYDDQLADLRRSVDELKQQIKGKQLPFYVRDGLEEIKALDNYDAFDLARIRLYLEQIIESVDKAVERNKKKDAAYDAVRNRKKEGQK